MAVTTEHPFTLPTGYVDDEGRLHRDGTMRLATARDEIEPLRDPRVKENEAYLSIIVLSRVVTELGGVYPVTPKVIEGVFVGDLDYLERLYRYVNFGEGEPPAQEADIVRVPEVATA